MLDLGLLHPLEEIHCEVPIYTKVLPAGLAKGAAEEQMKASIYSTKSQVGLKVRSTHTHTSALPHSSYLGGL
jgi:hypothetical protein